MADRAAVYLWQHHLLARIKSRLNLLYATALVFFVFYSVLDYLVFPGDVAALTISLRLIVVAPCMLLALWAHYRDWPSAQFMFVYAASYLAAGLSVVAIIVISHMNAVPVPYEGLFLVLAFGYFLTALPVGIVTGISLVITVGYLVLAQVNGYAQYSWLLECFFLLSANLLGFIGAMLLERSERVSYEQLVYIESARRRAVAESHSKTRFLAAASHDLKQPLGAIQLLLTGLDDEVDRLEEASVSSIEGSAVGQAGQIVTHLKLSSDLLHRQLQSFLDLSSLELGMLRPDICRFPLDASVSSLQAEFPDFEFKLEPESLAELDLKTDQALFERICSNLMDNAAKHSSATYFGFIVDQPDTTGLRIRIKDNGRGLGAALIAHINSDQTSRHDFFTNATGTGLGLVTANELAGLLGISVTVQVEEHQGAEFAIVLPESILHRGSD